MKKIVRSFTLMLLAVVLITSLTFPPQYVQATDANDTTTQRSYQDVMMGFFDGLNDFIGVNGSLSLTASGLSYTTPVQFSLSLDYELDVENSFNLFVEGQAVDSESNEPYLFTLETDNGYFNTLLTSSNNSPSTSSTLIPTDLHRFTRFSIRTLNSTFDHALEAFYYDTQLSALIDPQINNQALNDGGYQLSFTSFDSKEQWLELLESNEYVREFFYSYLPYIEQNNSDDQINTAQNEQLVDDLVTVLSSALSISSTSRFNQDLQMENYSLFITIDYDAIPPSLADGIDTDNVINQLALSIQFDEWLGNPLP